MVFVVYMAYSEHDKCYIYIKQLFLLEDSCCWKAKTKSFRDEIKELFIYNKISHLALQIYVFGQTVRKSVLFGY